MKNLMKLTIIRGLPGSGKSTLARALSSKTGAFLLEPDMLCMHDGTYRYTPESYQTACEKCLSILRMMQSDVIYTDVLPTAADVQQIINQFPLVTPVEIITLRNMPELSDNVHQVTREDFSRFVRIFEDVDFRHNKVQTIDLLFQKNYQIGDKLKFNGNFWTVIKTRPGKVLLKGYGFMKWFNIDEIEREKS